MRHAGTIRLLTLLASLAWVDCGPGAGGPEPGSAAFVGLPAATPATFQPGTATIVTNATLDATGGTLSGASGTPVEGVVVTVPAGALDASTTLSLGYDDGVLSGVPADQRTVVLVLNSSGTTRFLKPLSVTFPFKDATRIPVPYYVRPDGQLEIVASAPFDRVAGTGGFTTWHASNYTWLNVDPASPKPVYNGFDPARDGFPIDNTKPVEYAPKGRCWGMTNFSKWYRYAAGPGLAAKFLAPVRSALGGAPKSGQELIATRSHNSVAKYAGENQPAEQDVLSFLTRVRDALSKGAPAVMLGLSSAGGAHAVLAIAFTDNQVALYDPNHPGVFKALDYTLSPPNVAYGDYTDFSVFGNGELHLNEENQHVLDDANQGFHGENETKIEVTSHQDGDKVDNEDVSLEGNVHSGQVLIDELDAEVQYDDGTVSDPVTLPMPPDDDSFKLPLTLHPGFNTVTFKTKGYVAFVGDQDIPSTPASFTLDYEKSQQPLSSVQVSSTHTETTDTSRIETTTTVSANLYFSSYHAAILTSPQFDYHTCDSLDSACELIGFESVDSTDLTNAQAQPVTMEFHTKTYEANSSGQLVLTSYQDGQGTITCNTLLGSMFVEPGGTFASHRYLVTVKPGGVCGTGDVTPSITGKYKFFPDDTAWNDMSPESLTAYVVVPATTQIDGTNPQACQTPAATPSADAEAWAKNPTTTKTWSLTGRYDNCVDSGTTVNETANLTLTLVPN